MSQHQTVAILNTSIITAPGTYKLSEISLEQAKKLVSGDFISAVGHESTAQLLTTLLGVQVPMNRIKFMQEPGQLALVFKLNGRPPEGKILSIAEIEEVGYAFQLLDRIS